MNKTAIKNFAVRARNKLIADITYRAGLVGVSDKGIAKPVPQSSKDLQFFDIGTKDYAQISGKEVAQRKALVKAIQDKERDSDYATAFKAVIEEIAYTYINEKIVPTELTFFDPCMGSGHILVYAFDVLMQIYEECGYSDRDAALNIIQHNLFGLDIDKRAYQLAYFAVMMKARSYNRRVLTQQERSSLKKVLQKSPHYKNSPLSSRKRR